MAIRSIITIGRQYGSGGRYVGKLLSEHYGIPYYDKEVLTLAAQKSGISEELFEQQEQQPTKSLLFSLVTGYQMRGDVGGFYMDMPLNHRIFLAQFEAIRQIAQEGPCVIVGRCADYVLKENPEAVRVFVYADIKARLERVVKHYGIAKEKAEEALLKADKQRASYYNYYASGSWGAYENYNLMVDTGAIGIGGAVSLIEQFVQTHEEWVDAGRRD